MIIKPRLGFKVSKSVKYATHSTNTPGSAEGKENSLNDVNFNFDLG